MLKLFYIHGYLSDPNSTKGTLFKEKLNAKAIATDLPYGKGSYLSKEKNTLYKDFINNAYKNLKPNSKLVMTLHKKIKIQKFKTIKIIPYKVHATLTRYIYILKKAS